MHPIASLSDWTWDPLVIAALTFSSALYTRGVIALWRRAGRAHGVRRWNVAAFAAGQLAIVTSLLSPLDRASDVLFSAHMTQHELLILVAAPLCVLGRPLVVFLWGFDARARDAITSFVRRPVVRLAWRRATGPFVVLIVHGVVVWAWHVPAAFEAALASEAVHGVQHLMFFVTAVLFWWSLVYGRYGRVGYGVAVLYVFATAVHTSILGAFLTLGTRAVYPTHAARTLAFGVDPLGDQQTAGLLMWVPAGVLLTAIGLALMAAWLGEAERRSRRTTT